VGDGTSLYLIDADGSNERPLLPAGSSERYLYPSWSPTGSTIAFLRTTGFDGERPPHCADACQRAADRGTELWTVGADGSSARPLLPDASVDPRAFSYNAPAWSPDGTRLAFAAYVNEGPSDIQLLVVDPSALEEGPTQLTSGHGDALAPAWSPDGSRIAFIRNAGKRNELRLIRNTGNTYELRLIDADGSNERSMLFLVLPVFEGSPVLWEMLPAL
jgi:Tol biopolymer transport system component